VRANGLELGARLDRPVHRGVERGARGGRLAGRHRTHAEIIGPDPDVGVDARVAEQLPRSVRPEAAGDRRHGTERQLERAGGRSAVGQHPEKALEAFPVGALVREHEVVHEHPCLRVERRAAVAVSVRG